MTRRSIASFAVRLRDVLSTLEAAAVVGSEDGRRRGLGAQLVYAAMSLPCDEALVALELRALGRLVVPGVATPDGYRSVEHELLPSGTPFAFLLGGGGGFAAEVTEDDGMMAALGPVLETEPRYAVFVPLRVGGSVIGGATLLRNEPLADNALDMAEHLAEVLSLTLEAHRTERVLLELFATMLPDLCGPDAPTDFAVRLEELVHGMRLDPVYRRRLELAGQVARVAGQGEVESKLAADVLKSVGDYLSALNGGEQSAEDGLLDDDLYG
jgi:hypothetical protein